MTHAAPYAFLPYQQRWAGDTKDVKVCEKSRRIGLSWCEAADSALLAADRDNGMDVWYIGYNKDMAEEFIRDTADWAKRYQLVAAAMEEVVIDDEEKDGGILAFRIRFASGFRVTALSSRPSNLRGKQGRIVIDEAAFHDQLGELLKAAMAMLIWGGQVHVISTHNGAENPFNELVLDIRAGRKEYALHRIDFDEALDDGLYKRICLVKGKEWSAGAEIEWRQKIIDQYGDDADEELFCVPSNSEGGYLSRALITARMVDAPVLRWKPPVEKFETWPDQLRWAEVNDWLEAEVLPLLQSLNPSLKSGYGMDFGRSGDLTVIAPYQEQGNLTIRFPFLLELRDAPFKQQEQVLYYIADRLPCFLSAGMDSRGNGQFLGEYAAQRYGFSRIEQVMLSEKWYSEQMPPGKAAFEDATVEIPRDTDVLTDLRAIQVIKGTPKIPDVRAKDSKGGQRHADAAIAIFLGLFASRREVAPIEFETTGVRRSSLELFEERGHEIRSAVGFGSVGGGTDLEGF